MIPLQSKTIGEELGIGFLGVGFDPKWRIDEIPGADRLAGSKLWVQHTLPYSTAAAAAAKASSSVSSSSNSQDV
jgi:hypothetical protein